MADDPLSLFVWIWLNDDDDEVCIKHVLPTDTPHLEIVAAIQTFYGHLGVKSYEVEKALLSKYPDPDDVEEEEETEEEVPDVQQQLAAEVAKSAFPKRKASVKK